MTLLDSGIVLLDIGLIILTGLLFGKLTKLIKLPNVTGYLVGGLLIGPSVLGQLGINLVTKEVLDALNIISEIALGFIAFTIGTQFKFSYFKRVGAKPIIIAIFESLLAVVLVLIGLIIYNVITGDGSIAFALVLSAIAAATAPAATIMVVKQYRANGEVTKNLLSVVALDDAVALIIFGIMVAIANSVSSQNSNVILTILKPFAEVLISLTIGIIIGILLSLLLKWFTGRSNRISVITAVLLITCSLSYMIKKIPAANDLSISTLLVCMMIGAVFTNTTNDDNINKIMELVDRFTPPILIMFFVISGANLDLSVLISVGIIGIIYIVLRVVGKWLGAFVGASITKSSPEVKKYLGWTLIPQAGVAIGLTIVAGNVVPEFSQAIRAVVLSATLIYELIGPVITKIALKKAGEISKNA